MLKQMFAKLIVIFFLLISFSATSNAKEVDCYIITNNNDTIYGTIKLTRFNLSQKSISLSSYNTDELFNHIYFKSSTANKAKELFPDDLLEFGFLIKRTKYRYISRDVNVKMGNNKRILYSQIENGAIDLFETKSILRNKDDNSNPYGLTLSEYYILGTDKTLIKVAKNDRNEPVSDFLMKNLKLDKEILDNVAKNKTYKDIKEIIELYNAHFEKVSKP